MSRLALLSLSLCFASCAAARSNAPVAAEWSDSLTYVAPAADAHTPALTLVAEPAPVVPAVAPAPIAVAPAPLEEESLHGSRFTLKGGYYSYSEDAVDDGIIFNASWMTFSSKIFAWEFELGYIDADGTDGGIDTDLWSMPIMVNGRFNVPIWVLDMYAGAGLGGFYYNVDSSGGGDDDGFLFGGNAFLGATVNVADSVALGLEGKYYITDQISELDEGLDAFALMLTVGFSR